MRAAVGFIEPDRPSPSSAFCAEAAHVGQKSIMGEWGSDGD
jgi:hypothetical protein